MKKFRITRITHENSTAEINREIEKLQSVLEYAQTEEAENVIEAALETLELAKIEAERREAYAGVVNQGRKLFKYVILKNGF